jgi:hypothetical protein
MRILRDQIHNPLTLLAIFVGGALLPSLVGCHGGISEEERAAIKQVTKLGGQVNYRSNGLEVSFKGTNIEDADLAVVKHFHNLKEIRVTGTRISNQAIEELKKTFPDLVVHRN